jgi:putative ABC transport system permease protein
MMDSLYIAWKYLGFYRWRTLTLVAAITLIAALPLTLEVLLDESERQLLSRAQTTPLLLGAKGSSLDLVMNSLYFDDEVPELISMTADEEIMDTQLATAIPVYARFQARGFPIVGTTLDYFDFRNLSISQGRHLAMLGECVIGAAVAEELGLAPGDHLLSSPDTVFDLAGVYPLKMRVVGVLAAGNNADDHAVFVDVKTAWVIQGLVHGHEDVTRIQDPTLVMERQDGNVTATAKLVQFTEITEANRDSFHFHGDPSVYPLTGLIVIPHDTKSGTLLRGRYLESQQYQIVQPREVVDGLLENIFRIKNVLDGVILIVGIATVLAIILVFSLSLRLRQREINTIFKLGCSRMTIARLIGAEISMIVLLSGLICVIILLVVDEYSAAIVRKVIL